MTHQRQHALTITFTPDGDEIGVKFSGPQTVETVTVLEALSVATAAVLTKAPGMNRQDAIDLAAHHNGTLIDTILHHFRHPVYSRPTSPEAGE